MKEIPILMSAPMVRAILDGRKTQTRRIVKPVGNDGGFVLLDHGNGWWPYRSDDGDSGFHTVKRCGKLYQDETPHACPYGKPGDRLRVKEAIRRGLNDRSYYDADHADTVADAWPWKRDYLPSMFCPQGLSRILLEVVSVRVERLQDISEEDAIAEGVDNLMAAEAVGNAPTKAMVLPSAIHGYSHIWDKINGAGSWAANPWVWAITFKRVDMEDSCLS